jgi:hypothetical protein
VERNGTVKFKAKAGNKGKTFFPLQTESGTSKIFLENTFLTWQYSIEREYGANSEKQVGIMLEYPL